MSKRLYFAAVAAVSYLALEPRAAGAQDTGRISVEWQNARLADVMDNLATFGGRRIVVEPAVAQRQVTTAFTNTEWDVVLGAIVETGGLTSRVDSFNTIHIEERVLLARRITVEWRDARLSGVLDAFARIAEQQIVLASDVSDQHVTAAYENVDWRYALDEILQRQGLVARTDDLGVIRVAKVELR